MAKIFNVPIAKAPAGTTLPVDIEAIPDTVWDHVVMHGLATVVNEGKSKLTGLTKMDAAELAKAHEASIEISKKNIASLLAGKVKAKRGKKDSDSTLPREVQTEARRIARDKVKDLIRAAGKVPSHYPASEITKAADTLIASDPEIVSQARANIEKAKAIVVPGFDIGALVADETKVAESAAKKAATAAKKAAQPLSAKQAGLTTKRAKPTATATSAPSQTADFLAALASEKAPATSHTAH